MSASSFESRVEEQVLRVLKGKELELDRELANENVSSLPDDGELADIRRRRLEQMKKNKVNIEDGYGNRVELDDEKHFFTLAKQSEKLVLVVYRPSFKLHEELMLLWNKFAAKHVDVRVVSCNAEKCPFLSERFKIWCLPTMVLVKHGKTEHSIVGLDEIGGEKFTLNDLEDALIKWDMLREEC